MFHNHKWVKIEETYFPPQKLDWSASYTVSEYFIERALAGVTTLLWECSVCKKIRKEEMLGKSVAE